MKKIILLLVCVLAMGTAGAQETIVTIKGTITDSKTKESLPGVTVFVEGKYLHTQSNGDGVYVIKVPERLLDAKIMFSAFGYDRDTLTVREVKKHPDVKLKAGGVIRLSEVTVSDYKPMSLIEEAVKRIPQNCWTDTAVGTFFYRDMRQLNGELYLFDEMVFDAMRVGYDKHNTIKKTKNASWKKKDERAIESNYKSILFSRLLVNDEEYVKEVTGNSGSSYLNYEDNDVLFDPVEIPNTTTFFSSSRSMKKKWTYDMQEYTDGDGVKHYLVMMTSKSTLLGPSFDTVVVTITKGNLAITRVEKISDHRLTDMGFLLRKLFEKVGLDSLTTKSHDVYNYSEVEGKMTLTSFTKNQETDYFFNEKSDYNRSNNGGREHIELSCQGVLTAQREGDASFLDTNTIQSTKRIAVSHRQGGEMRYDEDFWEHYNFVPLEADLLRKLNARLGRE